MKLKERYKLNKEAKVGTECICPSCGATFVKGSYQQVFCKSKTGTKCKDKYWNTVDPNKRNNTTRFSPASLAYMARFNNPRAYESKEQRAERLGFYDVEDMENYDGSFDGSWDAHDCHTEPCDICGRLVNCECGIGRVDI
jgi:hypothetical protein